MENTKIQWATHTFNPWIGCTKVSPGCLHCYAETRDQRFHKGVHWGPGAARQRTTIQNWNEVLRWEREAAGLKQPPRVFCASLSDWLDDEVDVLWLVHLLRLIRRTPSLYWLLLSKRIDTWRIRMMAALDYMRAARGQFDEETTWLTDWMSGRIVPSNVWIGCTMENQDWATKRAISLVSVPARVHFVSLEPLLGRIVLPPEILKRIDWYIVGGESGKDCRPMELDWAREIRDQAASAGGKFFMKQLGGEKKKLGELTDFPEDLRIREIPSP